MALVPAVHREHDEIRAVLDVADDDAVLLPGFPPDGHEAEHAPAALVRRGPQEAAATEPVERSMNAPSHVHEPRRRDFRRSGCLGAHGRFLPGLAPPHHTPRSHGTARSPVVDSLLEQQRLPTGTAPPGKRSKPDSYRSFFAASSSTSGSLDPKAASSREDCRWVCSTSGSPTKTYSRRSLPAENPKRPSLAHRVRRRAAQTWLICAPQAAQPQAQRTVHSRQALVTDSAGRQGSHAARSAVPLRGQSCPVPSNVSHRGPDLRACFMLVGRFMGPDVPLT